MCSLALLWYSIILRRKLLQILKLSSAPIRFYSEIFFGEFAVEVWRTSVNSEIFVYDDKLRLLVSTNTSGNRNFKLLFRQLHWFSRLRSYVRVRMFYRFGFGQTSVGDSSVKSQLLVHCPLSEQLFKQSALFPSTCIFSNQFCQINFLHDLL